MVGIIYNPPGRHRLNIFALASLLILLPLAASAHDIPNDVTVQAYFRPAGDKLDLLVRVPLRAMRDMEFPAKGPAGFLDINGALPLLPGAGTLWISDFIRIYEDGQPLPKRPRVLATQLSLESDRSFESWQQAHAHVTGPPLPEETNVVWNQTMFDVLFEYPIHSDRARFSIAPAGLARLGNRVLTILRYVLPDGNIRAFQFETPPGLVELDPAWYQAALTFVHLGFLHILEGTDHLLFLLCLIIPFRKFRALIPVVTGFTIAHSITLIASAYNFAPDALWFPPLIETLIAASIVYMAVENIVGASSVHKRWMIAFGFGLVHGFGFSFALRQTLQLAGSHMLTSLLSFNLGVELGQLLALLLMIPLLDLLFTKAMTERMGTIIVSAFVADTGWHWMLDRADTLSQYHFQWPELTPLFFVSAMRWTMAIVFLAGIVWLVSLLGRHRRASQAASGD
ncbi:MAG TPA: HupE/UreJ family protein [Bryobacteraceae bacterium]|jgi:hypothetical protein|nr:HupE/UreJ family protein [Bryobacteraceae bacterium]